MLLVDGHVHLYGDYSVSRFVRSARSNFRTVAQRVGRAPSGFVLCMTDGPERGYERLCNAASDEDVGERIEVLDEGLALIDSVDSTPLYVIPGRQIRTRDRLEVLALGTTQHFPDGQPLAEVLKSVEDEGAVPVVPWGVGKWVGRRADRIRRQIVDPSANLYFVGDNGNRPRFWPAPALLNLAYEHGIWNLPGSDPLPVSGGAASVGRSGFILEDQMSSSNPTVDLVAQLRGLESQPATFGRGQPIVAFLKGQVAMRFTAMVGE